MLPSVSSMPTAQQLKDHIGPGADIDGVITSSGGGMASGGYEFSIEYGPDALTDNTNYDFYIALEDSAGNFSDVKKLSVRTPATADTTPPAFAADYPRPGSMQSEGSRQARVVIKAEEQTFKYYYVALEHDSTPSPTVEQIINRNYPGALDYKSGDVTSGSIDTGSILPGHDTDYDFWVVIADAAGNTNGPVKVVSRTPLPADFFVSGYPMAGDNQPDGSKQVKVKVELKNITDGKKGKVYWVLLSTTAAPPSIEQVADGTDGDDQPAISLGSPDFSPGSEQSFLVTGDIGNTSYNLYMVVGDTSYAYPLAKSTDVVTLNVTTPADILGEKVCKIGDTEYATVQEAVDAAGSTETITLLKSLTTVQGVIINSKNITFDLNGRTLNIDTTADEGLKVTNGSVVLTGDGELNASGKLYGVYADNSTVTVTNAIAKDTKTTYPAKGMGVYAINGSKVTVHEDAAGAAHGVYAKGSSTEVTVNRDVSNQGQILGAVYSEGQATVLVKGNVTSTQGYGVDSKGGSITVEKNVSGSHVGAYADIGAEIYIKGDLSSANNGAVIPTGSNGSITVDGVIKGYGSNLSPSVSYVSINGNYIAKDEGVSDPAKAGYFKYSIEGSDGVVWVRDPDCAIVTLVTVNGEAKFDQTLTCDIAYSPDPSADPTLNYQWKRNGFNIGGAESSTYTLTADDIGQNISVTVTASGTAAGSVTSEAVGPVQKADGPEAPAAPTLANKTHNSVTLTANTACQFSIDNGLTWQDSNIFTDLSPATSYIFVARIKATATHNESAASSGLGVTTNTRPASGGSGGSVIPSVTGVAIKAAPDKVAYTEGDELDLSGLLLTLTYSNGTTKDIALADFADNKITVSPKAGDVLDVDDKEIVITVKGKTVKLPITVEEDTTVIPPPAEEPVLTDIDGHRAKDSIEHLIEMGAISGYPDNTFRPDNPITRAEFATVLVKAMGLPVAGSKVFADTESHWAKEAISTAYAAGIISGYNEQSFGPDDLITREQMAVMVAKAAGLTGAAPELEYTDSQQISAWAREFVARAAAEKLISGYPDNTFRPADNATRAEAVTVISRKW